MKIVRFEDEGGRFAYGEEVDEGTARRISGDIFGEYEVTGETVGIVRRLGPVEPPNVFCIGLNYRKHAEESKMAVPAEPVIFGKPTTAVIADGEPIVLPKSAPEEVDYEAELAIVIGKKARKVSEAEALDYVLGYTCANDVSARDCQIRRDTQWTRGKGFDTFCPLGPRLVTRDEVDGDHLAIRAILNGETVQDSNTSDLIFPCRALVSFLSAQFTLLPGTVICTGTPEGVGFTRKPPIYLRAGDAISIEIEGIGRLNNPVAMES